jgi:hypothetical protein
VADKPVTKPVVRKALSDRVPAREVYAGTTVRPALPTRVPARAVKNRGPVRRAIPRG